MLRTWPSLIALALAVPAPAALAAPLPQPKHPVEPMPPVNLPGGGKAPQAKPAIPIPTAPKCWSHTVGLPDLEIGALLLDTVGSSASGGAAGFEWKVWTRVVGAGKGISIHGVVEITHEQTGRRFVRHAESWTPLLSEDDPCRAYKFQPAAFRGGVQAMSAREGTHQFLGDDGKSLLECTQSADGFVCGAIHFGAAQIDTEPATARCPATVELNEFTISIPATTHMAGGSALSGRTRTQLDATVAISPDGRDVLFDADLEIAEKDGDGTRMVGRATRTVRRLRDLYPRCIIASIETPAATHAARTSKKKKLWTSPTTSISPGAKEGRLVEHATCVTHTAASDGPVGCSKVRVRPIVVRLAPAPDAPAPAGGEGPI